MIYAACRWWNGNVVMLCMTVSRGSPRSSWHLIKLRLWTTSDKMAPWCNGGRESRRSSVPPKQELRTNLLNLFYQSCLPGAQEREEEQGLGSEGEGAATECLDSLVCLQWPPLCCVALSLSGPTCPRDLLLLQHHWPRLVTSRYSHGTEHRKAESATIIDCCWYS